MQPSNTDPDQPVVDVRMLWSGGVAAALIVALVAIVGVLIARGLFNVPVLAPRGRGAFGDATTFALAFSAGIGALLATGLMQALLVFTPRPFAFFGWVIGLVTAVATLVPLSLDAAVSAKIATALIHLTIGIAIGSLVSGVAARSVRMSRRTVPRGSNPYPNSPY